MARTRKKKGPDFGPYRGYWPQKRLFDYLSIKADAYDFPIEFFRDWAEMQGIDVPADAEFFADAREAITDEQLKEYEDWLLSSGKDADLVQQDPIESPAYLHFSSPRLAPKGTWAIHFTNAAPFESFEYGVGLRGLQLSVMFETKQAARCPDNLSDELGDYDYVYIFAFDALRGPWPDSGFLYSAGKKYGSNAVIFRTDAGVYAYHAGDEETQLIVPACSEYDVWAFRDVVDNDLRCETHDGEELAFRSPAEFISFIERLSEKKKKALRETLVC